MAGIPFQRVVDPHTTAMQPPQNPYNSPPYGQPQGSFAPQPQQPRGTVSLDVIGEAWNLVKPSLGQWALAMLLGGAALFALNLVVGLLQTPFRPTPGRGIGAGFWFISFLSQILGAAVQGIVLVALFRMAIAHIRTGVASINEMFNIGDIAVPAAIAAMLVYLITVIGLIFLVIPGIIASLSLTLVQPLIADQKLQPVDAIKRSWEVMKSHLGSMFVLGLVLGLLNLATIFTCGLGLFVTIPIDIVALALVYRDLLGVGGAPAQNTGYVPPPIANPNF